MNGINLTVGVLYSCHGCGLKDVEVKVPARESEGVIVWMNTKLQPGLGADHTLRSPHCASEVCDVKIPMDGTDRVGGATAQ